MVSVAAELIINLSAPGRELLWYYGVFIWVELASGLWLIDDLVAAIVTYCSYQKYPSALV